ncbi:hypothetical protein N2603_41095 [Bradyrhizobium huanghuaihaiense]|uniref:hypothetical protein n=1 Tax=Bradyrhizobium huanghuaihaiense TaxID=990078 RepID=UPI0021AA287C|nr:hypothetical protein [Bradyrhizobium sp. CB3035]UWU76211.1 hypothetical protein N2603_41095 [Bradyrhizobium sp. CB3035]
MTDDNPERKIERRLNEAKLWPLSSYGWVDENTADPDFIGHAMWQVEPPVSDERFFWTHSTRDGVPPPPAPCERQQSLMVSGTDFEGVMAWARLSIGFVLSQVSLVQGKTFSDETIFELHRVSALIYLSTASDRMRDFFIMAVFDKTRDRYDRQGQFRNVPRGRFKTAFVEALQLLSGRQDVASSLSTLLPLAEQVEELRKRRNEMIHELATDAARRERRDLAKPLTKAALDLDFNMLQEVASNHRRLQKERLGAVIEELCRWYKLLVKLSNEAFIVENRLRK